MWLFIGLLENGGALFTESMSVFLYDQSDFVSLVRGFKFLA